jgi:hypothetical protein
MLLIFSLYLLHVGVEVKGVPSIYMNFEDLQFKIIFQSRAKAQNSLGLHLWKDAKYISLATAMFSLLTKSKGPQKDMKHDKLNSYQLRGSCFCLPTKRHM